MSQTQGKRTPLTKLYGFHGGIHPQEHKSLAKPGQLMHMPLPKRLVVPLHQNIGAPAKLCVNVGEKILKGQLLAQADQGISAAVHAPSSGTIAEVVMHPVAHPSGLDELCIIINCDGNDQWLPECSITKTLGATELSNLVEKVTLDSTVATICASGIIGMGGAGFPLDKKLSTDNTNIQTLIINGVECEPYISSDDTLMQTAGIEIIAGARLLQRVSYAQHCIVAIEDNKPLAILALENAICAMGYERYMHITVIPTKYPSGGEKQLIENLTGVQVPQQGLPQDIGMLCVNVASVKAVHDAVILSRPSVERIITVTGNSCHKPGNYLMPVGTPIDHILEHCASTLAPRVIVGGPMMGFQVNKLSCPITKTSNCLLLPDNLELTSADAAMECIRCGQCELACPAQLLPQQLYWYAKSDALEPLEQHGLFDCIECGACAYVCPSQIPLVQHYRYAKGIMRAKASEAKQAEYAKGRFEAREQRLAQAQAMKEKKRKERAAQAAAAQAAKRTEAGSHAPNDDPITQAQARLAAKEKNVSNRTADVQQNTLKTDLGVEHHNVIDVDNSKALQTLIATSKTKLAKTKIALELARQKNHAGVDKLTAMVEKTEATLAQAEVAWRAHQQQHQQSSSAAPAMNDATTASSSSTPDSRDSGESAS